MWRWVVPASIASSELVDATPPPPLAQRLGELAALDAYGHPPCVAHPVVPRDSLQGIAKPRSSPQHRGCPSDPAQEKADE
jgi:hypothetical protein